MIDSKQNALAGYSRSVATSRKAFLKSLGSLPPPIANRIRTDFQNRIDRNHDKALLGEYAPWLLTDLVPISSRRRASEIATPWLHVYFYTLFTDDILDRPDREHKEQTILANALLLQKGLSGLLKKMPRRGNVRLRFDMCFAEAAEAALSELQRTRRRLHTFTENDVDALGKKVALLKACACCLIAADGQTHVPDDLLVPITWLATGAQLLDDAVDWEEDWRAENYTYVLADSFNRLQIHGIQRAADPHLLTSSEVMAAMLFTGSLERTFQRATELLRQVKSSASLRKESSTDRFLTLVIDENLAFRRHLRITRRRLRVMRRCLEPQRADWLGDLLADPKAAREVNLVAQRLQVLSQGPST